MAISHSIARLRVAATTLPSDLGGHACDSTLIIFDEGARLPLPSSVFTLADPFFSLPETSAIGNSFPFIIWEVMTTGHVAQITSLRRIRPCRHLSGTSLTGTLCVLESARASKRGQSVVRGGRGSMLDLRVPAFGSDFPVNHTEIKRGKEIFLFSELYPSLSTFKTHGKVQ